MSASYRKPFSVQGLGCEIICILESSNKCHPRGSAHFFDCCCTSQRSAAVYSTRVAATLLILCAMIFQRILQLYFKRLYCNDYKWNTVIYSNG
ncbi:hypothetical protein GOP47_0000139 [Adiantum capillus-veneris]|uniref:Uncharacterized protein n=1 Tax=Adiantum capillus-veneris TaxID=13818 RepID=A0A9D4VCH6_ADICA|nr:hypothetical protein GOP47_0000139 [Adiantum capillus-veneris]